MCQGGFHGQLLHVFSLSFFGLSASSFVQSFNHSIQSSCFIVLFLLCFSPILSTFTDLSPDVEFSITLVSISMTFSELFADSIGDPSSSLTRAIVGCK